MHNYMINKDKNAILVLSHLMNKDCKLDDETSLRLYKAQKIFKKIKFDYLITSGWKHQKSCNVSIAKAVKNELIQKYKIDKNKIIIEENSRDTVGDAIFVKFNVILPLDIKSLFIVTSNYHLKRTKQIFNFFFKNKINLNVIGIKFDKLNLESQFIKENNSQEAFNKTFKNADPDNKQEIFKILSTKHPYYNGEVFSKKYL